MEIEKIVELVEKIPLLLEMQRSQKNEIRSLKEVIKSLESDSVLDSAAVKDYTGYNPVKVREIMNRAGASKMHGKLWVKKSDLDRYLISNRIISEEEAKSAARNYLLKKGRRVTNKLKS